MSPTNGNDPPRDANPSSVDDLIERARSGDREALEQLVDSSRDYLLLIANQQLDQDIRRKVGASDIVQESLMTAQANIHTFQGTNKGQWLAWLKQILVNDLRETRRSYKGVQKRSIDHEQELAGSASLGGLMPDPLHTPGTHAALNEQSELLEAAIKQLPDDYQQVLRMRNWQHMTYEQIGEEMDRSPEAIRKIWGRAVLKLQELLPDHMSDQADDYPQVDDES